jgi:hypothetical protein
MTDDQPKDDVAGLRATVAALQSQLDELKRMVAKPEEKIVTDWRLPSSLRLMDQLTMPRSTMQDFVNGVDERTIREIRNDRAASFGAPLKDKEGAG